ncbi:MAG: 3-isopropylmalate dehydrogenase [Acidobacteria bacterium]|nr:3-isopropylmalate dehydrogenase [Acidobacteriota bacterium]
MTLRIAVLPGDGIGPEVIAQATRVLRSVCSLSGQELRLSEHAIGGAALRHGDSPLPAKTLRACRDSDAVLLGAVGHPAFDAESPAQRPEAGLLGLRLALGGFANLRPAICHDSLAACSPLKSERVRGADILIVRELLAGLYYGTPRGADAREQSAWNTMRYTKADVVRVARVAFEQARMRRARVTSVDKANVLETSRLWRATVDEVHALYPDIALDHMFIDTCAMRLATDPRSFDVILTENLFGDILSDEAAAVTGSLGVLGSATLGGGVGIFEPVHGSAPDIAGRGVANPIGAIASAALLLRHAGRLDTEANEIERAIEDVLERGYRTRDLAIADESWITTAEMGEAIEHSMAESIDRRWAYHAV